jgi:hypothetical protein
MRWWRQGGTDLHPQYRPNNLWVGVFVFVLVLVLEPLRAPPGS